MTAPRQPRRALAVAPLLAAPRYEVMPLNSVLAQTAALPPGSVVPVTASPRHGLEPTLAVAEKLAAEGLRPVPHLAARQVRDTAELSGMLDRLDAAGIAEVFVVGGDARAPLGAFSDGLGLLRAMADIGRLPARIGVPSYPEGHWAIEPDVLWSALLAKQEFAHYTVTQLCFDADALVRFAGQAHRRGVRLPIVAGVPGVVDARKLLRMSLRVGVGPSIRFVRGHRSLAGRLLRPGGYRPEPLVRRLGARMADGRLPLAGLHLYTFNQVAATARWVESAYRRAA